jgi:hypothetical protein
VVRAVAREIGEEICSDIIGELIDISKSTCLTINRRFFRTRAGHAQQFIESFNTHRYQIAKNTRRGGGNVVLCSPIGLSSLKLYLSLQLKSSKMVFESVTTAGVVLTDTIHHVGNIVNSKNKKVICKVLVSTCVVDTDDYDTFLIGYKGNSDIDTGYVYAPYIPALAAGTVMNPITFTPESIVITRYGKYTNDTDEFSATCNYYRTMRVQRLPTF